MASILGNRIESRRETDGKVQTETRHFALSWMPAPEIFRTTVRAHWATRNALHWQLDVPFRQDAARNRNDNGPTNIAILRRRAKGHIKGLALDPEAGRVERCVSSQPSQTVGKRLGQTRLPWR